MNHSTDPEREAAWQKVAAEIRAQLHDLDFLRRLGRANAFPVAYFVLIDEVERLRQQVVALESERSVSDETLVGLVKAKDEFEKRGALAEARVLELEAEGVVAARLVAEGMQSWSQLQEAKRAIESLHAEYVFIPSSEDAAALSRALRAHEEAHAGGGVCSSCLAGPGQGHDPDCNADRRPRENGVVVCKCEYSVMLKARIATLETKLAAQVSAPAAEPREIRDGWFATPDGEKVECSRCGARLTIEEANGHRHVEVKLAAQVSAPHRGAWVPCGERMPSDQERVLIWYESGGGPRVTEGCYMPDYQVTHRWQCVGWPSPTFARCRPLDAATRSTQ